MQEVTRPRSLRGEAHQTKFSLSPAARKHQVPCIVKPYTLKAAFRASRSARTIVCRKGRTHGTHPYRSAQYVRHPPAGKISGNMRFLSLHHRWLHTAFPYPEDLDRHPGSCGMAVSPAIQEAVSRKELCPGHDSTLTCLVKGRQKQSPM